MKRWTALVLAVVLALGLVGCGEAAAVKKTLKRFEKAVQEMNASEMLSCMDPDFAGIVTGGAGLIGDLLGQDSDELLNQAYQLILGDILNTEETMSSFRMKKIKVKVDGQTAAVTCEITTESGGTKTTRKTGIDMVERDETWYIKDIYALN